MSFLFRSTQRWWKLRVPAMVSRIPFESKLRGPKIIEGFESPPFFFFFNFTFSDQTFRSGAPQHLHQRNEVDPGKCLLDGARGVSIIAAVLMQSNWTTETDHFVCCLGVFSSSKCLMYTVLVPFGTVNASQVMKFKAGRRSDIWSLGCTVIEMITAEARFFFFFRWRCTTKHLWDFSHGS